VFLPSFQLFDKLTLEESYILGICLSLRGPRIARIAWRATLNFRQLQQSKPVTLNSTFGHTNKKKRNLLELGFLSVYKNNFPPL
jgi:hypothetical protein